MSGFYFDKRTRKYADFSSAGFIRLVACCPNVPNAIFRGLPMPKGSRDGSVRIAVILPSSFRHKITASFRDTPNGSLFAVRFTDAL